MKQSNILLLLAVQFFSVEMFAGPAKANVKAPAKQLVKNQKVIPSKAEQGQSLVSQQPADEENIDAETRAVNHLDLHLKTQVRTHGRRLATHQTSLESHQNSLNAHQVSLEEHQDCLDALKPSVADHEIRLDALEPCVDALKVSVQDHESRISNNEMAIAANAAAIAQNADDIADNVASIDELQVSVADHQASLDALQPCVDGLKISIADHEERIGDNEMAIVVNAGAISALGLSVDDHENELNCHDDFISTLYRLIGTGCLYKTIIFDSNVTVGQGFSNEFVVETANSLSVYAKPSDELLIKAKGGVVGITDSNFKNLDTSMVPDGSPAADVVQIFGNTIINGNLSISGGSSLEIYGDLIVKGSFGMDFGAALCVHGDIIFDGAEDQTFSMVGSVEAKGSSTKPGNLIVRSYVADFPSVVLVEAFGSLIAKGDIVFENNQSVMSSFDGVVRVRGSIEAQNVTFKDNRSPFMVDQGAAVDFSGTIVAEEKVSFIANSSGEGVAFSGSVSARDIIFKDNEALGTTGDGVFIAVPAVLTSSHLLEFVNNKKAVGSTGNGVTINATGSPLVSPVISTQFLYVVVDCSTGLQDFVNMGVGSILDYYTGSTLGASSVFTRDTSSSGPAGCATI